MKNILIITTSPRRGGNSDTLAGEFARGAKESGNNVEIVSLIDIAPSFCRGCMACQQGKRVCVIKDNVAPLLEKMRMSDVIVWATPVYYYSVSGQMKTMIDRANPLYGGDYRFTDVYLLATAAEDEPTTFDGAIKAISGWSDCFERSRLAGTVLAGGVDGKGDIAGHRALGKAYEIGRAIK